MVPNMTMVAPPARVQVSAAPGCHRREQAEQRQHGGDEETDMTAGHPGQLDDAVVLGEGGHGKVEKTAASMELAPSASTPP
jgi:hypothetical protein